MKYKAAVIGLGKIGQGYDYNCNDRSLILTHASSYHFHASFDLDGGADVKKERCLKFEKKYKVPSFTNIEDIMNQLKPEVVSISTPTDSHYDIFNQVIPYGPKAIIIEKPFTETVNKAHKMISNANSLGIILIVNYVRRFEPGTNKLKKMICNGLIGDIYKGNVWYCKGLKNNGSHFIDLLMYFFGDVDQIKLINEGRNYGNNDVEPDFMLRFNDLDVLFQSMRSEYFSIGKFTLIGTKGIVRYSNGKIQYKMTRPDPVYQGYKILQIKPNIIETDFNRYQYYVMDTLDKHFRNNDDLKSDGISATETLKIVEKIIALR